MQNKKFILGSVVILLFFLAFFWIKWQQNNPRNFIVDNSPLLDEVREQDHLRGAKNPTILLIVYSDFECPFCKKFNLTLAQIIQNYPQAAWVFRHFPLPFHQHAQKEAEASECAAELGGKETFWKFHDLLFQRTRSSGIGFSLDKLAPLGKEVGIEQQAMQGCIDSGRYENRVAQDMRSGQTLGINGTPSTLILTVNGKRQLVVGALEYQNIKDIIDNLLK